MKNSLLASLLLSVPCFAATILDFSQVPLNSAVESFGAYANPNGSYTNGLANAASVGGVAVSISTTNPDGSYLGDQSYNLGVNGFWGAPQNYWAVDFDLLGGDAYSVTLGFSAPVSSVAALFNYRIPTQEEIDLGIAYSSPQIEALDQFGAVLESLDIGANAPINTNGTLNNGAYRGFSLGNEIIYGLRFSNSGILLTDLYLFNASIALLVADGSIPGKVDTVPDPGGGGGGGGGTPPNPTEVPEPSAALPLIIAVVVMSRLRK